MVTAMVLSSCAAAVDLPATFDEARRLGEALENGAVATEYQEKVLAPYFANKYAKVLQSCVRDLPLPDTQSFTFIAAIGLDGRILRLYPDHDTNVFECLKETLADDIFPPPPVVPYFMHVEFQFTVEDRDLTAGAPSFVDRLTLRNGLAAAVYPREIAGEPLRVTLTFAQQ
ncbi:MAG TPA: hypothetical protein VLN59_04355 [Burkholderiales bacterium]|nr:hypothetical protein [Burkholderiales bacterium]